MRSVATVVTRLLATHAATDVSSVFVEVTSTDPDPAEVSVPVKEIPPIIRPSVEALKVAVYTVPEAKPAVARVVKMLTL
jgi:hypothetical protein